MTKRHLITLCFAFLAVSAAFAQERKAVPPPPKPADEAPNLEVTMKFIEDKLNDLDRGRFVAYVHDNSRGTEWTTQFEDKFTHVAADPGACRLSFHWREESDGDVVHDDDIAVPLKNVEDILVMTEDQHLEKQYPSLRIQVEPPVFVVLVRGADKKDKLALFSVFDEQLANRLAKAMVHAVELCGGGSKPEPF